MKLITEISQADMGRVAKSKDGRYHIRVLELLSCDVEGKVYVRADDIGRKYVHTRFLLVGGAHEMYWEEEDEIVRKHTLDVSSVVYANQYVNKPRTAFEVMAYLASETGECADWLVNPERQKEDLLGECADVIICALDLALVHKEETSDLWGQDLANEVIGQLNDLLNVKVEKWMNKHA